MMFRSLFIGLVILSALTAEGAALPHNYGSLYLFINEGLSMLHENVEVTGKIQEIKTSVKPFGKAYRNACALSSGGTRNLKFHVPDINFNEIYNLGVAGISAVTEIYPVFGDPKEAVLKKSDSSPPRV